MRRTKRNGYGSRAPRGVYKSYHFLDHDPIMDAVDTLVVSSRHTFDWIADKSGVTTQTMRNWRKRKVKRPQFASIRAVVRALDAELVIRTGEGKYMDIRYNQRRT